MLGPSRLQQRQQLDRIADGSWLVLSLLQLVRVQRDRDLVFKRGSIERRTLVELTASSTPTPGAPLETPLDADDSLRERIRASRRTLRTLRAQRQALSVERARLIADTIFAAYDALDVRQGSEAVRCVAGLLSATLGLAQACRAASGAV